MKNFGIVKVFGSKVWHGSVTIIGNKIGLEKLRDLIDNTIKKEYHSDNFIETDGEGYEIEVLMHDYDYNSVDWIKLPVHYTDDIASEKDKEKWKYMNTLILNKK